MTIRTRVRQWLGITEIQEDQALLHRELNSLESVQARILGQVSTMTPGLGREAQP